MIPAEPSRFLSGMHYMIPMGFRVMCSGWRRIQEQHPQHRKKKKKSRMTEVSHSLRHEEQQLLRTSGCMLQNNLKMFSDLAPLEEKTFKKKNHSLVSRKDRRLRWYTTQKKTA